MGVLDPPPLAKHPGFVIVNYFGLISAGAGGIRSGLLLWALGDGAVVERSVGIDFDFGDLETKIHARQKYTACGYIKRWQPEAAMACQLWQPVVAAVVYGFPPCTVTQQPVAAADGFAPCQSREQFLLAAA